jgi:putative acetyltransferase
MIVRDEAPSDHATVRAVVRAAFGQPDEAKLVDKLRDDGDCALALVAEDAGEIVGHVLLSTMIAPFAALALAPASVVPAKQRAGVGSLLIRDAIRRAHEAGCAAIFVLGDPEYYQRFGFDIEAANGFDSPYAGPHFMALPLSQESPSGPMMA